MRASRRSRQFIGRTYNYRSLYGLSGRKRTGSDARASDARTIATSSCDPPEVEDALVEALRGDLAVSLIKFDPDGL